MQSETLYIAKYIKIVCVDLELATIVNEAIRYLVHGKSHQHFVWCSGIDNYSLRSDKTSRRT